MTEPRTISLIQSARIASPCDMKWEDMTGDDRVRHCEVCDLNVYNFAAMSEDEANELLASAEGRICGRLWRRFDGTIITADCPVGLRAVRRKMVFMTARIVAATVALCSVLAFGRSRDVEPWQGPDSTYTQTKQRIETWLNNAPPPVPGRIALGGVCAPPPAPVQPVTPQNNSSQ